MPTANKPAQKRKSASAAAKQKAAEAQARKRLYAILLFALGALLIAITAVPGEKLWLSMHQFFLGSFSWCAYLLGPVLLYTAVMIDLDKTGFPIAAKLVSSVVLIVMLCGASHIFSKAIPPEGGLVALVDWLYQAGMTLQGGGVAGALLGIPLMYWLEFTGAAITIVVLIFVCVMILSGSTLVGLIKGTLVRPVQKMEEAYVNAAVNRAQQAEEGERPQGKVAQRQAQMRMGENKTKLLKAADAMDKPVAESTAATPVAGPNERFFDFDAHNREGDKPQPEKQPTPKVDEPEAIFAQPAPMLEEATNLPEPPDPPKAARVGAPAQELTLDEIISRAAGDPVLDAPLVVPPPTVLTPDGLLNFDGMREDPLREQGIPMVAAQPAPTAPPPKAEPAPQAAPPSAPAAGVVLKPEYHYPPVTLLTPPQSLPKGDTTKELKANADRLVDTLKSFGVQTRIVDISRGPAVTRYELQPSAGVKISRITNLADDIALNLAAAGVRIEAPIPNKAAIGIEVPNKVISAVPIREILDSEGFSAAKSKLTVVLGKDITGELALADLGKMPHLLIAGATGSGKSVCINSLITSLLFKAGPDEVKLLMIDPKVVELGGYNGIPHLLSPVVTDPKKAAGALCTMVGEMLRRYKLFADSGVRDLAGFNKLAETREELQPLPQIVIIIDELADLMMASPKDVEDYICRLAQMARAAGMHLVIATQRPSVDVITGVIKANIPSRISFAVSSQIDSRTILDMGGAEKLLGRGDMLFYPVGSAKPTRIQGCFVTDSEVERVVDYIKGSSQSDYDQTLMDEIERNAAQVGGKGGGSRSSQSDGGDDGSDELLDAAIEAVVEAGQASTSLLQRRIKVGYARAARLVDEMEQRGIVGPFEGSKPRQVLLSKERWYEMKLNKSQ